MTPGSRKYLIRPPKSGRQTAFATLFTSRPALSRSGETPLKTKVTSEKYGPRPEYDGWIVFDPTTRNWVVGLTRYDDEQARYTLTLANPSLTALARETERILWQVENEEQEASLLLPDMGDFTISYFPD